MPEVAGKIINACVVLHNLCIENNIPPPEDLGEINIRDSTEIVYTTIQKILTLILGLFDNDVHGPQKEQDETCATFFHNSSVFFL